MKKSLLATFLALEAGLLLRLMNTPLFLITGGSVLIYFLCRNLLDKPAKGVPVSDLEMYSRTALISLFVCASITIYLFWMMDWSATWSPEEVKNILFSIALSVGSTIIFFAIAGKREKEMLELQSKK